VGSASGALVSSSTCDDCAGSDPVDAAGATHPTTIAHIMSTPDNTTDFIM
jgi:hypothetical protein